MVELKTNLHSTNGLIEAEKRIQTALHSDATTLSLVNLSLKRLPDSLWRLTNLTTLNLFMNELSSIPEQIGELRRLLHLDIQQNHLTEIPMSIGELKQLRFLHLGSNQLKRLPDTVGNLSHLMELYVQENQLKFLPASLRGLVKLWKLFLSRNRLQELPEVIGELKHLKNLYVQENQLTALPASLQKLPRLRELYLAGNPQLGLPVELIGPSYEDLKGTAFDDDRRPSAPMILDYYFRVLRGRRPLNEAKLILLGRGEVGKTCLVNRLVHNKFSSTTMTRGIEISQWALPSNNGTVRVHVWDFGGQEIQHATHQFFLTERSLYLIVLNGRAGAEDDDAEYWLKFVKTFGASSPTIVVLNKFRVQPFQVNRRALEEKYPFIRAFVETDTKPKTKNGMPALKREIEAALSHMDHVRTPFPSDWFDIKDQLAQMKEPFISFKQYRKICVSLGETDEQAQEALAVFLNALGIALNFRQDQQLREETVLNPHWITEGVYQILTSETLIQKQGELRPSDLSQIFTNKPQYPRRMHGFLIELMRKFELCFPYHEDPTERRFLVPELLSKEEPILNESFRPEECVTFRYEYRLMPEGLLPRFITRTHPMSTTKERWRSGVVLHWEGCRALIKADKQDRVVLVRVAGELKNRRRLLAVIRENFDQIHAEMREFKPTEWVAMEGHVNEWISHRELEIFAQKNYNSIPKTIGNNVVAIDVAKVLSDTDVNRPRNKVSDQDLPLRTFISYSHKDEEWRAKLSPNLDLLQREGLINVWHDQKIVPGTRWGDEIRRNLEEADIYVFLMSTDLLVSDYILHYELPIALKRHAENKSRLVPVVVRRCSWQRYLGEIQGLPRAGKPIKQWSDKDEAFYDVEEGLRKTIHELNTLRHLR